MRASWIVLVLGACGGETPSKPPPSRAPEATGSAAAPAVGSSGATGSSTVDDDSRTPQPFQEQAESSDRPVEATVLRYRATWSNVMRVSPTCWFFSGPDGRDTPLGDRITVRVENGHGWLTWDKASFEGTWSASVIDVFRLAKHSYGGAWVISERLVGARKETGIHATYTYNECQQGTACPGECSITADVLLVEEPGTP